MSRIPALAAILATLSGMLAAATTIAQDGEESPVPAWNLLTAGDTGIGTATERGKAVFDNWCAACHSRDPLNSGTASLQVKYNGAVPAALEDRTDLSAEIIRVFVRNGVAMMPGFRKTEISEEELAMLSDYLTRDRATGLP